MMESESVHLVDDSNTENSVSSRDDQYVEERNITDGNDTVREEEMLD